MHVEYVSFDGRSARSEYVARRFADYLSGSLLDVGCDRAVLKTLLPNIAYTGVDKGGDPDVRLDLDEVRRLPFDDCAFDCVLCSHVLEHLENLHAVFGELVRVTARYLIVALPNNWTNARRSIERGRGRVGHYGLPAERPTDRHKWFFGLTEAADFLKAQQARYPISIVEMHVIERPRPWIVRALRKLRYPRPERYLNRYANALWAVFEKRGG